MAISNALTPTGHFKRAIGMVYWQDMQVLMGKFRPGV